MGLEALIGEAGFTGEVRYAEPMSAHTSLRIGGPAEAMAYPASIPELAALYSTAVRNGVPVFFLGRGTNLLVLDGGIPGLTVNMGRMAWIEVEREGTGPAQLHAGAGLPLAGLIRYSIDAGLSGLEFAAGIPGTLGGAVMMNAGAGDYEMKDVLTSVRLVDSSGEISLHPVSELEMGYRSCRLPKEDAVVAEASLALVPWPREEVKKLVTDKLRRRKNTQPLAARSAGSTFRNPPGYSAWKLIDMAGLRGRKVGKAMVSTRHTNFLINTGGATAKDFRELMELVVSTVKERLNIELEPEIRIVGVEV